MSPAAWAMFLVAAGAGAAARYLVDQWVHERARGPFRWGTFLVNVSGSLALGVVTGLGLEHGLSDTARTTAGTGALGAYTTFSTFSWEAVRLIEQGDVAASARYVGATLVVGLVAAATGLALTGAL